MQLIVRKRGYRIIPALAILAALVLASVVVFAVPLPAGTANAPNFEFDPNEAGKNGVLEDDAGTDGVLDWDGDDSVNAAGVIDACRVIDDDADASTPPTCDGAADSFTNADIGECRQANAPAVAGTSDGAVPGSGTAGAGLLVCDGSAGNFTDRDHFTGGSKNEGTEWDIVGGSNPKKGDFAELMLYAKFGDSPFDVDTATDDLFIFTGSSRLDVNGSTHLDAELNQRDVKRDCTNDGLDPSVGAVDYAACETARTVGDILIAIDLESGGNPQLRVFKFCGPSGAGSEIPDCDPSTVGTDACENSPQVNAQTPTAGAEGCFVLVTALPGGGVAVAGDVNRAGDVGCIDGSTPSGKPVPLCADGTEPGQIQGPNWDTVGCERTPPDDDAPGCRLRDDMPAKGFMETFVDLAAFGIDVTCPGFSNLVFKTRASDELNSELKDDSESTINISKCSLRWEKRDDQGALQGGATFSVDGADANNDAGTSGDDGPFYCQGDTTDPVTVVDNGLNDSDPAAGKILLDNACFGTYTITETVAPPGFARDKLLSRTVTVSAGDPNAEIGTSANDCADSNPDNEEDFCNRLGTLSWEKRSAAVAPPHPLLGGATFKIDGADANNDALTSGDDGPFRCQDTDTTNDLFPGSTIGDEDDPALLIVDDTDGVGADSVIDKDPDAGQIKLERVCLGTYTVTETAPPGDFLPDTDPTRVETVSDDTDLVDNDLDLTTDEAEELNAVIGTAVPSESSPGLGAIPGTDDHSGAGGTTLCTNNSDECDFHNRRGSLIIRKEAKDARTEGTHDLLAGAKFRITPDPLDGVGTLDITDDLTNDVFNSTGGVICIDNVIPRTDYSIVELESFTIYKEDSSTKTNVASSSQSCAGRTSGADPVKTPTTVSPDALFTNIPLSKITVSFESLVATGVTKARIECKDKSGTIVPTPADGTLTDFDDTSEVYTGLVPNDLGDAADIYTCTIKIDP